MRQFRKVACLGAVAAVLSACGSTSTHRVMTGPAQAPHSHGVEIIMAGAQEPPFVMEIAIIQAHGKGTHSDLEHVVAGLQLEAQKLGCDAVIRVRVDQGSANASANGVCVKLPPGPLADQPSGPPVAQPGMLTN